MDFTAISSLRTQIISPRCGQRTGVDGMMDFCAHVTFYQLSARNVHNLFVHMSLFITLDVQEMSIICLCTCRILNNLVDSVDK